MWIDQARERIAAMLAQRSRPPAKAYTLTDISLSGLRRTSTPRMIALVWKSNLLLLSWNWTSSTTRIGIQLTS